MSSLGSYYVRIGMSSSWSKTLPMIFIRRFRHCHALPQAANPLSTLTPTSIGAGMLQLGRNGSSVIWCGSEKLKQRESSVTLVSLPTVVVRFLTRIICITIWAVPASSSFRIQLSTIVQQNMEFGHSSNIQHVGYKGYPFRVDGLTSGQSICIFECYYSPFSQNTE